MPLGRPTKLTTSTAKKIVDAVRAGNFFETACRAVGIHRSTGYDWIARGERWLEPPAAVPGAVVVAAEPPKAFDESEAPVPLLDEEIYIDFALALRAAEAEFEMECVRNIRTTKKRLTQKGEAFILMHRFPSRFGRRNRLEHSGPDGGPIETRANTAVIFIPAEDSDDDIRPTVEGSEAEPKEKS